MLLFVGTGTKFGGNVGELPGPLSGWICGGRLAGVMLLFVGTSTNLWDKVGELQGPFKTAYLVVEFTISLVAF